mmetsp:Transcript_19026/g.22759  ORF Transcript_19026/g.22759 Transcript_19026/m.22759 type:complete len:226 (+) Transcript_19026:243-920(+)
MSSSLQLIWSKRHSVGTFPLELNLRWVDVLADGAHVCVGLLALGVLSDLLWVHSVHRVQVLHGTGGVDTVDAAVGLEVVAELCKESQALFLAGKLQQVWSLAHDSSTPGWHFEDSFLLCFPGEHVELLNLGLAEETTGAAAEDGGRCVRVKGGRDEGLWLFDGLLCWLGVSLLSSHDGTGDSNTLGTSAHAESLATERSTTHRDAGSSGGLGGHWAHTISGLSTE